MSCPYIAPAGLTAMSIMMPLATLNGPINVGEQVAELSVYRLVAVEA